MKEYQSLSHTRRDCKYHVVFIPKRRKKRIFGMLRRHLGEIFHELKMAAEAEKGHTASMKKLVELYIDERQPEKAETWLTKVREKGDNDIGLMTKLASLYIDKQTKLDREQPGQAQQVDLLEKAATLLEDVDLRAQNEGREDVSSINLLGWAYERMYRANGLDSYKGYAIACYRRAADKGGDYASSRLKALT